MVPVGLVLRQRYPRYTGRRWTGVRDSRAQPECGEAKRADDGGFGQSSHQLHRATLFYDTSRFNAAQPRSCHSLGNLMQCIQLGNPYFRPLGWPPQGCGDVSVSEARGWFAPIRHRKAGSGPAVVIIAVGRDFLARLDPWGLAPHLRIVRFSG
jgi:hypothetical protein